MARIRDSRKIPEPPVKNIYDMSDESLSQLKTWFEQTGIRIPVSQLNGSAAVPNASTVTVQHVVDALVALRLLSQDP
jgi:hypothetical protein